MKCMAFRLLRDNVILSLCLLLICGQTRGQKAELPVNWQKCALEPGEENVLAECATIEFPLFFEQPDGPIIRIAVKRLAAAGKSRAQLWFIEGGPGDSGTANLHKLRGLWKRFGDIDIYTLDHRGVGGSERLRCPAQEAPQSEDGREITEAEWPDCIDHLIETYGERLQGMSTTESAHDLGRLIEATRQPGKKVFVWGISYGTVLVNRYLHLYPNQPDGVILDGIVPADWTFSEFDDNLNTVARRFLERCAKDSTCSKYLGRDPVGYALEVVQNMEKGSCKILRLPPETMRLLLGVFLMSGKPLRDYIPALLYRVNRCEMRDIWALVHLFNNVLEGEEAIGEPESHSQPLSFHVSASELWAEDALSAEAYKKKLEKYVMTTAVSASMAAAFIEWPVYRPPDFHERFADYSGPLLMLHGGLDPTMPVERLDALRQHFSHPNQSFVFFPEGQHVVLNEGDCAVAIYEQFLRNPEATLDVSCIEKEPESTFTGDPETTRRVFGTTDMWGDKYVQSPLRYYLSFGAAWPVSPSSFTTFRNIGPDFRAGLGFVFNRKWELVATGNYSRFGLDEGKAVEMLSPGGERATVEGGTMDALSGFINVKYHFSDFFLASHAVFGAGVQDICASEFSVNRGSEEAKFPGFDETSFALDFGLGLSFAFSAGFRLQLEPHYAVAFAKSDALQTFSLALGVRLGR